MTKQDESLFSLANIQRQYVECRRHKRNTANALRFEAAQEMNLLALRDALADRSYEPGRSVCFFIQRPKLREIFAADFRDRVVHHVLVSYLERIWEPVFIHDSYACRRGKGVHAAVARLQQFMRQATANGTREAFSLQLDIRNYFMSIDKPRLFEMLRGRLNPRRPADEEALWLAEKLVFHDCTHEPVLKGDPRLVDRLPPHKTLFRAASGKGLPIGNLNSQFFANVYLNALDQFVKHELKCRWYLRYCDDFVLLATDPETLRDWRGRIEAYLTDRLALVLNPRQRLAPVANGIDFLGYIVRRDYRLVRRRVVGHLKERLRAFENELVQTDAHARQYRFDPETLDRLAATLASYLGHLKQAQTWRLWQALWARHAFLSRYFRFDACAWKLVRRYTSPRGRCRARQQYHYWKVCWPDGALFFQVGRFIECYDAAPPEWVRWLGLKRMRPNRRGAHYGFPLHQMARHLRRLLGRGLCVTVIGERERPGCRTKERVPVWRYEPMGADSPGRARQPEGLEHGLPNRLIRA